MSINNLKRLNKILLILLLSLLLIGCSSKSSIEITTPESEIIYLIPQKVSRPIIPALKKYNTKVGLDEPNNFKKFQQNTVLLIDHIECLNQVIDNYEQQIDDLEKLKKEK